MISSDKGTVENTEKIAGAGLTKSQGFNYDVSKEHYYSIAGAIASILSNEVINAIASNVEGIGNEILKQNKKYGQYAGGTGYLLGELSKIGLCGLRNLAVRIDRLRPIEGIIKMLRYCNEEKTSFIMDVTTAELITALPIPDKRANRIYLENEINSTKELNGINYQREEAEKIGAYLYYMLKASGQHVETNEHFIECMDFLGLNNFWNNLDEVYHDMMVDKTQQVIYSKEVVNMFSGVPDKFRINPRYVQKVVKKLSYYMPTGSEKETFDLLSKGIGAYLDEDYVSGINVLGEGVGLIINCKKDTKSDLKEECRNHMVKSCGIEGNTADKVILESEDIVAGSEKTNEDNIKE